MNPNVYTRPNKANRLVVGTGGRKAPPALPPTPQILRVSKETQCFVTPSDVALKMVHYLEASENMPTLEPQAGTGQLLQALLDSGHPNYELTAIEKNTELWTALRLRMRNQGFSNNGFNQCFLEYAKQGQGKISFPRIITNPPFSRGDTDKHIKAALTLLSSAGSDSAVMVALVPSNYNHPEAIDLDFLPSGTFFNTGISTKIIRFERVS